MSRKALASLVLVATVIIGPPLSASDPAMTEKALKLVAQAVQAEIDGDLLSREKFLNEAKQTEYNFAPANWLRGQVISADGSWVTVDEAIEQGKSDKLLASYEAMRAEQPPTIQGNLQAAAWCAKNKLPLQCRAHIENVLNFDADHQLARKLLGHVQAGHEWLTLEEQCRMIERAELAKRGFAQYQPTIVKLVHNINFGNNKLRQASLDELRKFDEPEAIPVLENAIESAGTEIGMMLVTNLGRMEHPEAALALARVALFSTDKELKTAAIAELKSKPLHDFIPELLHSMEAPMQCMSVPLLNDNGLCVGFRQAFSKETSAEVRMEFLERKNAPTWIPTNHNNVFLMTFDPSLPFGLRHTVFKNTTPHVQDPLVQLAEFRLYEIALSIASTKNITEAKLNELEVEQSNRERARENESIGELICMVTDKKFDRLPHDVWNWWDEYNQTAYQQSKSSRIRYQRSYSKNSVPDGYVEIARFSCFVAGTEVQTSRGLRKIETILPGDLVLSKDISTGELSFKPVIAPTTRKPAKTVILKVDEDTIHATTSHLLWVCGKGWTKAGEIKTGDLLHAAAEPAVVISSTPGAELPTHNLIVADTHTYFVGASRILSHDVLPRGAVHELIPGQFMLTYNR